LALLDAVCVISPDHANCVLPLPTSTRYFSMQQLRLQDGAKSSSTGRGSAVRGKDVRYFTR